ncbi:MAG: glycine betaine ABC transporter substrate-binding protein [Clostridium sp.]
MKKKIVVVSTALAVLALGMGAIGAIGCSKQKKEIIFADVGWDSVKFHNAVAGLIAESAYGYTWKEMPGSSPIMHEAMKKGEIDVNMEEWTDNLATYHADKEAGLFQDLGTNFGDNIQGFYVPAYVIKGDADRGIEPMAPDLKTVQDLKKYPDIFPDDEHPEKGRIYGAIPGWEINEIMRKKVVYNGLDKAYNYFQPGSDASLSAAFTSAYEKGEAIVGYYWEPTWLTGKYDLVLLEDTPYVDEAGYKEGRTACPSVDVTIGVSNGFYEKNPEFCEFLKKYKTSSALTSEALAHMQDTGEGYGETAKWFLTEHSELIDEWLPTDKVESVKGALGLVEKKTNYFFEFPFKLSIDVDAFDASVKGFAAQFSGFFNGIKSALNGLIGLINGLLKMFPWWLLLALVFIAGYKLNHKLFTGILYAALLFFIGMIGLWDMMYETLSIVLASVVISLLIGFPVGILISGSERANSIARPILDTMQTMPVFVYLIPAVLFFGLGKAPAVIATTIYAVVPVIRLTSHGIRQVDTEVVEAARAFGSTKYQCLFKVQIPQALPTILTGVNQTLMMAMAMVVTCSMIGASGLGMEVLISVNRIEIGRGLLAGSAVVIVAILMDRLTQGWFKRGEDGKHDR